MSKRIVRNTTYNVAVYGSTFAVLVLGMVLFLVLGFVVKGGAGIAMFVFAGLVGVGTIATLILTIKLKDKIPADAQEKMATLISYDRVYIQRTQSYGYILTFQHDGGEVVYHSSVRLNNEKIASQMKLGQEYPVLVSKNKVYIATEKLQALFANQKPEKIQITEDYEDAEDYEDYDE